MLKNIRYHDFSDSLWFESEKLGECDIDKDGDFSFQYDRGNCFHTFYIPIDELRQIINLYDNRKNTKLEYKEK
jgi:hypothetical protein